MAVSVLTFVRPLSVKTGLRLGLGLAFHQFTDKGYSHFTDIGLTDVNKVNE